MLLALWGAPLEAQEAAGAPPATLAQDTLAADSTAPAVTDTIPSDREAAAQGEPVVFAGDTLFRLHGRVGPFGPGDRARAIEARLTALSADPTTAADSFRVTVEEEYVDIVIGGRTVVAVTAADAEAAGVVPDALAAEWAAVLQSALIEDAARTGVQRLALAIAGTLVAGGALAALLWLLGRFFPVLYRFIRLRGKRLPAIRVQNLELVSTEAMVRLLVTAARIVRTVVTLLLIVVFTPLVLGLFPATRRLSQQLTEWILSPLAVVSGAILDYLPNLFSIAIILVVTWYGLKVVKLVFDGLDHGALAIPGFYQDWAAPTYQLVRVLVIVLTFILIWPYLPSSDSDAFRGVAAFVGLLLTFGSASAVANVVGGVVMIYMRPFQVGDRVKIADTVGDVVEKGLLVTRMRTIKRVEITIPNSMVLASHIVNYSATAADNGIILHTAVTIGYDAPWRRVQQVMLSAARDIDGILETPPPFVLQTALGDYAVTYELNAYTDRPGRMAVLYSRLHEGLQDRFAEAGIEIMSPAYHALRDGDASTIPAAEEGLTGGLDAMEARAEAARAKAALEEAARAEEAVGEEARAEIARENAEKAQALAEAAAAARKVLDTARAALASEEDEEAAGTPENDRTGPSRRVGDDEEEVPEGPEGHS